ncbi:YolD-like family protein [Paenibacillus rhizophilus]|uniref:YolD-like family protein n=1 Tax=Paenibacillus rhizophilus TaxID=1850366 RepID=A0A3N9P7Z6_9BACL|nr:YolD-like family protein [Paenibacillus rhizophilus]RQW11590.1 YolD-like family protein [Paenibacillus rhizophilus]
MGKKLEGNGLLESSRMMLPEDKKRIPEDQRVNLRLNPPIINDQKREEMGIRLTHSLREHVRVNVVMFDSCGEVKLSGFVTSIHAHSREIKLQWADEWKWIGLDSIMEVYPG